MVPKFHWDYFEWQVKANRGEKRVKVNKSCFSPRIIPALFASGTFESPSPTTGCWDIDWQQHCWLVELQHICSPGSGYLL